MIKLLVAVGVSVRCVTADGHAAKDCTPSSTTLKMKWNMWASSTGLYEIEGCEGVSPTLNLKAGTTYTFLQQDESNWFHPVGFAYEPGGAHMSCGSEEECPEVEKPDLQYYMGGPITSDESGFGLDAYEPFFFNSEETWISGCGQGACYAKIKIPATQSKIYYFCHIHKAMSAIINVVGGASKEPEYAGQLIPAPMRGPLDKECGTTGLEGWDSSPTCFRRSHICGSTSASFNKCMAAADCKMQAEMSVGDANPINAFMRQMIAHHENAVNQAKIVLKHATKADAGGDGEAWDEMTGVARDIIARQNHQINYFQGYLGDAPAEVCAASGQGPEILFWLIVCLLFAAIGAGAGIKYAKKKATVTASSKA
jgi:hypothetical protein